MDTSDPIDVYINYDSFSNLYDSSNIAGGLTTDEVIGGVLQAMEQWNHAAAGRELVYRGFTSSVHGGCGFGVILGGVPNSTNDGVDPWISSTLRGQNSSECGGRGFTIKIVQGTSATVHHKWSTGDPATANRDLIVLLTHELGHSEGIYHPNKANAFSVMEYQNVNRRDLYQLDTECAELYNDSAPRSLAANQFLFSGGSYSSSAVAYSGYWSTTRA